MAAQRTIAKLIYISAQDVWETSYFFTLLFALLSLFVHCVCVCVPQVAEKQWVLSVFVIHMSNSSFSLSHSPLSHLSGMVDSKAAVEQDSHPQVQPVSAAVMKWYSSKHSQEALGVAALPSLCCRKRGIFPRLEHLCFHLPRKVFTHSRVNPLHRDSHSYNVRQLLATMKRGSNRMSWILYISNRIDVHKN